jgi:hypothetical protein
MRYFSSSVAATIAAGLLAACSANAGSPTNALPNGGSPNSAAPSGVQGAPQTTPPALSFDSGWIQKDGIVYHTPHYMATAKQSRQRVQPDVALSYGGGPVEVSPKVYYIFWGYKKYGDANNVAPLLEQWMENVGGGDGHNNIYTQYYEISGSTKIYITNAPKQYGGAWDDETDAVPLHPTDAQVAAEALRGVAHFGYDQDASYVVATPHGRSSIGFPTKWCGYHSAAWSSGRLVSYTNLPYVPDAGGACGASSISAPSDETAADEGVTIVEGHEQGESVTDPEPFTGWNSAGGEIGDLCAWTNIKNDRFGSHFFTEQPMWSNASSSCVHVYP